MFVLADRGKTATSLRIGMLAVSISAVCAACASVDVQHLDADGTKAIGAPGLRYYLPKPYLLVTLLPPDATAPPAAQTGTAPADAPNPPPVAAAPKDGAAQPAPRAGAVAPPGPKVPTVAPGAGQQTPQPSTSPTTASTSPSASGDTSFMASTSQYVVKLIYLPDYQNPMSITVKAGLFGTASFNPTLQDGWMLTSLQGSADNSQLVQLATQLVTSLASGTGTAAKTATTAAAKAAGGGPGAPQVTPTTILAPGLYEIRQDKTTGTMTLCAATLFTTGTGGGQTAPPACT